MASLPVRDPIGDHLLAPNNARRAIQQVDGFDHVLTEGELIEISDGWRHYRSRAVSYLFASEYHAV